MIIKNNFQRNLVMFILVFLNNICLASCFFILLYFYNASFIHILLIFLLNGLYYNFFHMDFSKKIFKKYCNKNCHNCSMWHCDFHYKDNKYVK